MQLERSVACTAIFVEGVLGRDAPGVRENYVSHMCWNMLVYLYIGIYIGSADFQELQLLRQGVLRDVTCSTYFTDLRMSSYISIHCSVGRCRR